MRRVIGIDIHRTFGEVVVWDSGVLRHAGRIDMTRTGLEGLGKGLKPTDEVVIEATGNCMAVARVLSPFFARVVIANPLQVKAIAHAHVKTDKVDAGTLASLHAAGFLPEIWTMTYTLIQLAPGAYDLLLNSAIMGSVVRTGYRSTDTIWTAELLEDLPPSKRPAPFVEMEHSFPTLEDLCAWLGSPQITSNFGRSVVARRA